MASSSSIFDWWKEARKAREAAGRGDGIFKTYLDVPPHRDLAVIFQQGNAVFEQIKQRYNIDIWIDTEPMLEHLIVLVGQHRPSLIEASEEVHKAIREQVNHESYTVVQRPVDLLVDMDIKLELNSRATKILARKEARAKNASTSLFPPDPVKIIDAMPEFAEEMYAAISKVAKMAVQTGAVGLRASFGHVEMPRPRRFNPQLLLPHKDFYALVENLGDRATIKGQIWSQHDIKRLFAYLKQSESETRQTWSVAFPLANHEIEVDLALESGNEGGSGGKAEVLQGSYTMRKLQTSGSGLTVICPQRRFDWELDAVHVANQRLPENAEKFIKSIRISGVSRLDGYGQYPSIHVQPHPGMYFAIRTHHRIRIGNCYWLQGTVSRQWNDIGRLNQILKADELVADVALFVDAKSIADAVATGDMRQALDELLPPQDSMSGAEAFLYAMEGAQNTLDNLKGEETM